MMGHNITIIIITITIKIIIIMKIIVDPDQHRPLRDSAQNDRFMIIKNIYNVR